MSEASAKSASSVTRGKLLMVIAAAVVAALGYLAWSSQKPKAPATVASPPAPSVVPTSQAAEVRTPTPRPPPRPDLSQQRAPRVVTRAPSVVPPPVPDGGTPRASLTKSDVREAQSQLHRAADGCVAEALKTKPDLGLRMAIRYTLSVTGGEGRALNPRISKTLLNDPEVEKCILHKITSARWPVNAPDGILHVAESFNFKHLQRTHISD